MTFLNVTNEEWEDARAYFERNKTEIKYRKADTLIGRDIKRGKQHTHSFVQILGDVYALNNEHHIDEEPDVGKGSFGRVKFAMNQKGNLVVVKIMGIEWHESFQNAENILKEMGQFLGQVKRTVREGESGKIKSLKKEGYLTTEKVLTVLVYLGERDLFAETRKEPGLTLAEGLVLCFKSMFSVWHLHQKRILHRDIKEENFVLSGSGLSVTMSLVDFDFAVKLQPDIDFDYYEVGKVRGTLGNFAPEILKWRRCSFASDVYALGAMFKSMGMPSALYKPMMVEDWEKRFNLLESMEVMKCYIEKHMKDFSRLEKAMLQELIKEYNIFKVNNIDYRALIFANKRDSMGALNEAKNLNKEALLVYARNIILMVAQLQQRNPQVRNPSEIFKEKNKNNFYVLVIQLLFKKNGFPSEEGVKYVARQIEIITKSYSSYVKSGFAKEHAKKEAGEQSFLDENSKAAFITKREKELLDLKLHEYSVEMKTWLMAAFQFSLKPILEVFKPVQDMIADDPVSQQEFMMSLFSTFGVSTFANEPKIREKDPQNLFLRLFCTNPDQNAAADQNRKLLEKHQVPLLLHSTGVPVPKKALIFSKRIKVSKSPKRIPSPSLSKSSQSTSHSSLPSKKNGMVKELTLTFRKKLNLSNMRRASLIVGQDGEPLERPRLG